MTRKKPAAGKKHETGSKILLQILILILIVFIISGIVSLTFYLNSTGSLTQKSKDKMINSKAEDTVSGFSYVADVVTAELEASFDMSGLDFTQLADAVVNKKVMPFQVEAGKMMNAVIEKGVMGAELLFAAVPATPPLITEPIIIVSSDESLVYTAVPETVNEIYKSGKRYGIAKNGIPEWNMKGETLVVFKEYKLGKGGINSTVYANAVRPIQSDIDEINGYFNSEKKKINILMIVVIVSFSIILFIIIFVVLRYLIRSKITKPIDELSEIAEKVMDGDIDVEVPLREGEEFANLKRAFNEMLKSVRTIISRSTGEE